MKLVVSTLFIVTLVLMSSSLHPSMALTDAIGGDLNSCGSKCAMRCMKADVKVRCMRFCGICCQKCKCVPSGTFGNKHECPCYRDMVNKKGNPKCP